MNDVSEMGEAPLGKLLLKFSLPSIAIMLVNGLYNFIDRIFIGQGMGTDALAARSACARLAVGICASSEGDVVVAEDEEGVLREADGVEDDVHAACALGPG